MPPNTNATVSAQAALVEAIEKLRTGQAEAARPLLERAVAEAPRNAYARYQLGLARFMLGQYRPAIEDFTAARAFWKSHFYALKCYQLIGMARDLLGNPIKMPIVEPVEALLTVIHRQGSFLGQDDYRLALTLWNSFLRFHTPGPAEVRSPDAAEWAAAVVCGVGRLRGWAEPCAHLCRQVGRLLPQIQIETAVVEKHAGHIWHSLRLDTETDWFLAEFERSQEALDDQR